MRKRIVIAAVFAFAACGSAPAVAQVTTGIGIGPAGVIANSALYGRQPLQPVTVRDNRYPYGYVYDPVTRSFYRRYDCTSPYSPYYNTSYCR